ncbi:MULTISPECIES: 4-hydroxythreonine-4-phosphate dehydrogenase PdxA [Acidiphilium]|jgi:4-hydroxythreonine-4-phosphate dehydrogenase|uniref:4-hydroxythreonine-4-phosphate dehydrogenase n=1 Tax=Acidiphilium multivorum (strain DSM 11245 / JCM 8867 / NBRC 100883 / AIU 301) TaxID=926570 RepID=F0J4V6_ACIMA|nr:MULTISPECIES: 4-hydroxythreonine-4-phosphate dehydrogenase PdxA [Acidiphilium]BAJ82303.1 4-hydroxythreonine-4-phosphate dehydrogenase [Acidiphilium multivorum AIU301]
MAMSDAPIALTMGDPAGIGGEIAAAAWRDARERLLPFALIGDADWAAGFGVPVARIGRIGEAASRFGAALPVLDVKLAVPAIPGRPDPRNAAAVTGAIETATRLALAGEAAAVVTCPIAKSVLYQAGFPHPGHTEFLGALTGVAAPVMMLACPGLRVVPVTVHVSLRRAIETLETGAIVAAGRRLAAALTRDFGVAAPRIAVAGLNPHAGEAGAMGDEELTIIAPAIAALRQAGIDAFGPLPPDTMFTPAARAGYDAALCMYHDQALIPLKTIDMENGVNVTLGLPIIRTSPDHGTAFDIAGTGKARAESLIAALRLAGEMAGRR